MADGVRTSSVFFFGFLSRLLFLSRQLAAVAFKEDLDKIGTYRRSLSPSPFSHYALNTGGSIGIRTRGGA